MQCNIQNMNTGKHAEIRVCYLRAIGRQIESLKQSFETELTTFYTQQSFETDASLHGSKSVLSETHSGFQCNDPYPSYPLVNKNEPPPHVQPPRPFVPFRQSPGVCFNGSKLSDLCGRYPYPGMRNHETHPPPPLVSPLQNATDVLFTPCTYSQDTSLNGSKCGLSQSDTHSRNQGFECNDPYPSYPMANNIETPQPLPYFPLRQSPTFSTFYTRTCSQAPRPQSQDTYHVYTTRNAHYHHDW
eukprot:925808_1